MATTDYTCHDPSKEGHSTSVLEEKISSSTLRDTLTEEAVKVGHSFKMNADFDPVTEAEKQRLDKQVFPDSLMLSSDVNLSQSKKAFLNLTKNLDDSAKFDQLWNLQPHNPHTYQPPIGI